VQWIGELIAAQKRKGVTVVFITHRLPEVRSFCDSMTVLRNGQHIASGAVSNFTDAQVIEMIVGRKLEHNKAARAEAGKAQGAEVLGAQDLATSGKLQSASFSLHAGEILGVAGLQGMGQRDLFLACFGMAEISGGTLRVDGVDAVVLSPSQAIQAGICLVPEDRKTEGLFLELNGRHNASMPVIQRFIGGGLIDHASETDAVGAVFERLDIDRRALWTQVKAFSGGNQQKIAIAKWFVAESRILLLYDPTRGIDVGTKNEIYQLIRAFAQAGGAVLLYSTEIPELVHLADRVMVFYGGRVCAEIAGEDLSEKALLRAALGNTAEAGALA
jgi:ribose transport system ATP-binding protein